MLKTSHQDSERLCGTKALWMLSFDFTNRSLIKAIPSAIETLQSFTRQPNKDVVKASQGVLWEVERVRDSLSSGKSLKNVRCTELCMKIRQQQVESFSELWNLMLPWVLEEFEELI